MDAPKHLSDEAKTLFAEIVEGYDLEGPDLKILRVALEAYDRAQAAREQIEREGMAVPDRFGQLRAHPLLSVERDSRAAFLQGMKALRLDVDDLRGPGRPPNRY